MRVLKISWEQEKLWITWTIHLAEYQEFRDRKDENNMTPQQPQAFFQALSRNIVNLFIREKTFSSISSIYLSLFLWRILTSFLKSSYKVTSTPVSIRTEIHPNKSVSF